MKTKRASRKLLAVLLAVVLVACMASTAVFANETGTVKTIKTVDELVAAIENQQDGETWEIQAGTYDLGDKCRSFGLTINGEQGFVFPITADNLTIRGVGDVTITSSYDPGETEGGVWHNQNFITISGSNVTLENLTLKGNPNGYYDGFCNKVIELIDGGAGLTLTDIVCAPLKNAEGQTSGSIYINVPAAGDVTLKNVTLYSWINARAVTDGTVTATNVVQDFTDNVYAGYFTEQDGYAWRPGISGDNVQANSLTIKVDNKSEFIEQIVKNLRPGTTVELAEDIEINEMIYLSGLEDITFDLNGNTITASDSFTGTDTANYNDYHIMYITDSSDITITGGALETTDTNKNALVVATSDGIVLNNVTLDHTDARTGAPLVINGSDVTVNGELGLITGTNSWYGVNLDNKSGKAELTFAEDATVDFENAGEGEKSMIYTENSNPDAGFGDPVITNNSDKILIEEGENGNFDVHTHAATAVAAKDATCTKEGNIAYWHCEGCGKYFSDEALTDEISEADTVVEALEHDWSAWQANGEIDCTHGYTEIRVCARCEEVETRAVAPAEHNFVDGKCTVCGAADPAYGQQTEDPSSSDETDPNAPSKDDVPVTGDEANVALWALLTVFAAVALCGTLVWRKRLAK